MTTIQPNTQGNGKVLPDLVQLQAQLAAMVEANKALQAKIDTRNAGRVSFKVSDKGAVSVYGLGRFPVTLYAGQWASLFTNIDAIKAFIAANKDDLAVKV